MTTTSAEMSSSLNSKKKGSKKKIEGQVSNGKNTETKIPNQVDTEKKSPFILPPDGMFLSLQTSSEFRFFLNSHSII